VLNDIILFMSSVARQ